NRMSAFALKSASRVRRPFDSAIHDLLPGIRAARREAALIEPRLRRRLDAGIGVGFSHCLLDARLEAGILLQHATHMIALDQNAGAPAARAPLRLVIPPEKVNQNDPQRTRKLVVLLAAHVVELLGDIADVGLIDTPRAQQGGLLERPAIEVVLIASR